jgi:hypothetical protein
MRPPSERTYQTFVIHQILPPLGWQAVFVDTDGAHVAWPVALLALVTRRERLLRTKELVETVYVTGAETEEEGREVVALDYDSGGSGFNPCDEVDNYCGLLPPKTKLTDFLKDHQCPCQRPKTEARYHPANPFFDLPVAEVDKGARP